MACPEGSASALTPSELLATLRSGNAWSGNMLYKMDPDASYDLHRRAYEAFPGEAAAALEWAMERQRRGEYAEAVPLYQQFAAKG